jgi:TonB family protein
MHANDAASEAVRVLPSLLTEQVTGMRVPEVDENIHAAVRSARYTCNGCAEGWSTVSDGYRTVNFLRYNLISGGDIHYPLEAAKAKQQGSAFYLMKLAADGSVASLTLKRSTGHKALDDQVARHAEGVPLQAEDQKPDAVAGELRATRDGNRQAPRGRRKGPAMPSWL